MITVEQLVQREVGHCVSYLVSTIAGGYGMSRFQNGGNRSAPGASKEYAALDDLAEQAMELAAPVEDYEEAARQAGWSYDEDAEEYRQNDDGERYDDIWSGDKGDFAGLCAWNNIEPYQWEVYEHWIVSDWLADRLIVHGEKVDKEFAGLCVWARTTTGQAIAMDAVMQKVHAELTGGGANG